MSSGPSQESRHLGSFRLGSCLEVIPHRRVWPEDIDCRGVQQERGPHVRTPYRDSLTTPLTGFARPIAQCHMNPTKMGLGKHSGRSYESFPGLGRGQILSRYNSASRQSSTNKELESGESGPESGFIRHLPIMQLVNPGRAGRQPFCVEHALESVAALTTGPSAPRTDRVRLRVREVVEIRDRICPQKEVRIW